MHWASAKLAQFSVVGRFTQFSKREPQLSARQTGTSAGHGDIGRRFQTDPLPSFLLTFRDTIGIIKMWTEKFFDILWWTRGAYEQQEVLMHELLD